VRRAVPQRHQPALPHELLDLRVGIGAHPERLRGRDLRAVDVAPQPADLARPQRPPRANAARTESGRTAAGGSPRRLPGGWAAAGGRGCAGADVVLATSASLSGSYSWSPPPHAASAAISPAAIHLRISGIATYS
jgi:hypothetical protein